MSHFTLIKNSTKQSLPIAALIRFAAFTVSTIFTVTGEPLRLILWPDESLLGEGKSEKVKVPITVHLPVPEKATGTYGGSRRNLFGAAPSAELMDLFSNEKPVTAKTPPAFLPRA